MEMETFLLLFTQEPRVQPHPAHLPPPLPAPLTLKQSEALMSGPPDGSSTSHSTAVLSLDHWVSRVGRMDRGGPLRAAFPGVKGLLATPKQSCCCTREQLTAVTTTPPLVAE